MTTSVDMLIHSGANEERVRREQRAMLAERSAPDAEWLSSWLRIGAPPALADEAAKRARALKVALMHLADAAKP